MKPPIAFEEMVGAVATHELLARLSEAYGVATPDHDGDREQYSFLSSGMYVLVDDLSKRVISCALFSRPGSRWAGKPFSWDLPAGLAFGMSREEARGLVGTPADFNDRFRWDRWDLGPFRMRAGYTTEGRIVAIDLLAG
jgi:hypothetical protein